MALDHCPLRGPAPREIYRRGRANRTDSKEATVPEKEWSEHAETAACEQIESNDDEYDGGNDKNPVDYPGCDEQNECGDYDDEGEIFGSGQVLILLWMRGAVAG